MVDRITPTYRPLGWPVGHQSWRRLLFLHWPVPVAALRPLVPAGLTLDLWEGTAYVSVVAFEVTEARASGVPAALGLDFLETNVRTYVHVDGRDPGIYFFSLDAASALAVAGARVAFGLPYFPARGRMRRRGDRFDYAIQRRLPDAPGFRVSYVPESPLGPAPPGSLDHFLLERYLLHVERQIGLWAVQVHHRPYPVHGVRVHSLEDELTGAAGLVLRGRPALAHYATQVDVDVFAAQRSDGTPRSDQERRHTSPAGPA